jgi:hypothetical protein
MVVSDIDTTGATPEPTTPRDADSSPGEAGSNLEKALRAERQRARDLERQLKQIQNAQADADEARKAAEMEARGEFEKLKARMEESAARLKAEAEASRNELAKTRRDVLLKAEIAKHVHPDAVEDVLRLHGDKFRWDSDAQGILSDDGGDPAEYFAALAKAKPFYAAQQPKSYGVQGAPTGKSGAQVYTRQQFEALDSAKRAEVAAAIGSGHAVIRNN